jgi:hypothetical protein
VSDRTAITSSFLTTSILGGLFLLGYWSGQGELNRGVLRSVAFVGIMGGVHSVGYRAYRRQGLNGPWDDGGKESVTDWMFRSSSAIAPGYLDGLKLALVEQVLLLGLSALLLDGGHLFRVCVIATLAYWAASVMIVVRRPVAPTSFDLAFIRYGSLILPLLVGWVAYLAWSKG